MRRRNVPAAVGTGHVGRRADIGIIARQVHACPRSGGARTIVSSGPAGRFCRYARIQFARCALRRNVQENPHRQSRGNCRTHRAGLPGHGHPSVAVFSDADRAALHVRMADEAYRCGPAPSRESYLRIENLMDIARRAGCDALHPGYGFLAENPELARACAAKPYHLHRPVARSDGAPGLQNRGAPTRRARRRADGSRNSGSDRNDSEMPRKYCAPAWAIPCC